MNNKDRVLEYLKAGHTLTAYDGFRLFQITSVRDYISMLKKDGVKIASEWRESLTSGKRWKEYWIEDNIEDLHCEHIKNKDWCLLHDTYCCDESENCRDWLDKAEAV